MIVPLKGTRPAFFCWRLCVPAKTTRNHLAWALNGLLIVLLSTFVLVPMLFVLKEAFLVDGRLSLEHFQTFLETPYLLRSLWHSLVVSTGGTLLAVSLAFVFAFTVHRTRVPGRALFATFALLPLVSPPVVLSMALLLLFGRQGLLTPLLKAAFGFNDLYGPWGIVLAMGLTFLPHAYLLLEAALTRLDTPIEEAAQSLGARFWTLLWRVTLPMARPALARAFLMVFALCLTDFGNPMMIGGDYKVAAVYLFDLINRSVNDVPLSAAMGITIVIPCIVANVVAQRIAESTQLTGTGRGAGNQSGSPLILPWSAQLGVLGVCSSISLLVLALYMAIGMGAVVKAIGADHRLTLQYFDPATPGAGWDTLVMTVQIAFLTAAVGAPLSILIAWLTERVKAPGARVLQSLAMSPAALPGVIFGLGYLIAFHAPPLPLTNTPWILILCLLMANLYVGVLAGATALAKVDPAEEEAATSLGARGLTPFVRVVLPQLSTAFVNAFFFFFVRGMISLSAVIFLVSANYSVTGVAILNRGETGDYGVACAMSVQVLAVVLVAQGLLRVLENALRPFSLPSGGLAVVARLARQLSPVGGEPGSPGRMIRQTAWVAVLALVALSLLQPGKQRLNVISAYDEDELYEYLEGFKAAHPEIELNVKRLSSGQLVTRQVFEKDNPGADVVFGLIELYLQELKKHGVLEPYTPRGIEQLPARYRDPEGYYFNQDVLLIALGVNTEVMAARGLPVPRTWEALTDPRYRGLVSMASPAASGTALTIVSRLVDLYQPQPWAYLDRLDKNIFQYTSSGTAPGKLASQGEVGIGITFDFPLHKRRAEGYPLEVVYPDQIPYTVEGSGLIRGGRHRQNAQIFLDWAASVDAMRRYERRKALVTHTEVGPSEAWKQEIPLDRLYELRAPFDGDTLVKAWSERYDR